MKTSAIIAASALLALNITGARAQMSAYDYNAPVGWASIAYSSSGDYSEPEAYGITGSGDANPVRVTTKSELNSAMSGTTATTIYIDGEIEFDGLLTIKNAANKTIYGLPGSALVNYTHTSDKDLTGILRLRSCSNIIMRNVTFKSSGAYDINGNDNFYISDESHNIWVDHCDFQDGVDGNFDCSNGSDNITITWCRFRYLLAPWPDGSGGSDDHRFSNLWGNSDSRTKDKNHMNGTFYACWWDEGCRERMPRVRYGKVHMLNCLYSSSVTNYCVAAGYMSNVYVERCAFIDISRPWRTNVSDSKPDYHITLTGNTGAEDCQEGAGSDPYFIPSDYYALEGMPVDLVQNEVSTYAGATLDVVYGRGVTTNISGVTASDAEVEATEYFSPSGMRLSGPQSGLNIVRRKMSDGSVTTVKVMFK